MEMDARINDLHEMAAIGNLKAVLHYCQSGVDVNGQNTMNGWTALHWATHRGHEPIVRALLLRGARKDVKNKKGETPVDLAKKPEICELYGKEVVEEETEGKNDDGTKNFTFVPSYLTNLDLSKLWSLPDGSTDNPKLNQEAFALSNPKLALEALPITANEISTNTSTMANINAVTDATAAAYAAAYASTSVDGASSDALVAKEILVYSRSVTDDHLLGAIFANVDDTIEKTVQLIHEEIDDVPTEFNIARYNGSKMIPVNMKQYARKTGDMFRGQDDVIVLIPK